MPGQFFSKAERERLQRFPSEVAPADLIAFFTLSESDLAQVPVTAAPHNQLGFALQLCALRYLGFVPDDLSQAPADVVQHVAVQLGVSSEGLSLYGKRPHTRTDHLQGIIRYFGFRKAAPADLEALDKWLMERALEHDKPTLLFQLAREKLLQEKILRPGVTSLERLIVGVRQAAEAETYRRLEPLLVESCRSLLDTVSVVDETRGRSPLAWLQQSTNSNSPKAILGALEKLDFLKGHGVQQWDLTALTPNRRKFLAQLARRSTNQALLQAVEQIPGGDVLELAARGAPIPPLDQLLGESASTPIRIGLEPELNLLQIGPVYLATTNAPRLGHGQTMTERANGRQHFRRGRLWR